MKKERLKILITQKINLGNYETRDYAFGYDILLEDGDDIEKIKEEIRTECTNEAGEYYRRIKTGLSELKKNNVLSKLSKTDEEVAKKIDGAKSNEDLEALKESISVAEDKKAVISLYNEKKIKLNEVNISK